MPISLYVLKEALLIRQYVIISSLVARMFSLISFEPLFFFHGIKPFGVIQLSGQPVLGLGQEAGSFASWGLPGGGPVLFSLC